MGGLMGRLRSGFNRVRTGVTRGVRRVANRAARTRGTGVLRRAVRRAGRAAGGRGG